MFKKFFRPSTPFLKVYTPHWLGLMILLVLSDISSKVYITNVLNFHLARHQVDTSRVDHSYSSIFNGEEQINILGENGSLAKFRLVFNDRFVFGSGPVAPVLGVFLTLFAIMFLFLYRWHNPDLGNRFAWLLVFSGAFGNLIDKMFVKSLITRAWVFGFIPREDHVSGVVDFIEVIWFGWEKMRHVPFLSFLAWETWPTFNLADSFIVVGISLLVLTMNEVFHVIRDKEKAT